MAVKLSPVFIEAQFQNGIPASGGLLFTYAAGSSTKLTTYTDATGTTPQSNPIVLNARGEPASPIWLTAGLSYKFVFAGSTDSDPPTSPIRTIDNISGVNDTSITIDQWISSGLTPTYITASSFSLSGDQTSNFQLGRRVKCSVTAGTVYGTISSSVFTTLTTVGVILDSGVLDSGLSSLSYGLLTPDNPSFPSIIEDTRQTIVATATTTPLWDAVGKIQDWTGTPTITAFPDAPQAGSQRIVYPAAGTVITDNANIDVQGNASYTVISGDELTITAITTTTFYVTIQRKNGLAVISPSASDTVAGIVELLTNAEYAIGTDTTRALTASVARSNNIVASTAQASTSGTSIDFTGIPSWAKRITVMFNGVSTNGTSIPLIQLGSGSVDATGYLCSGSSLAGTAATANYTTGFGIGATGGAAFTRHGLVTLDLISGNIWIASGFVGQSDATQTLTTAGSKTLAGALDRVRLTTVNGTDTFDAGSVNVMWE